MLGGDCSILIGVMLALRRRGRYGLACLDGPDFRHPDNTAHVGGAVVLGMRTGDEFADEVRQTFTTIDAAQIMTAGGQAAARQALPRLTEGTTGFWVHLDADVLDPSVMPAVDTPEPGGLDHPQLAALLSGLLGSPACVGLDLTIYDPHRDPQQVAGAALVDTLVAAVSAGQLTPAREARGPASVPLSELGLVAPKDLDRPVEVLSVGQRRRLALALLVASAPQLLLLDEPTNHISLALAEELEAALRTAPAAVVVASHDRWLRRHWDGAQLTITATHQLHPV